LETAYDIFQRPPAKFWLLTHGLTRRMVGAPGERGGLWHVEG
jgi:hypothetical protein